MPQQFPVLASDHAEKYRFEPDCELCKLLMRGRGEQSVLRAEYSCYKRAEVIFFLIIKMRETL